MIPDLMPQLTVGQAKAFYNIALTIVLIGPYIAMAMNTNGAWNWIALVSGCICALGLGYAALTDWITEKETGKHMVFRGACVAALLAIELGVVIFIFIS